MVLSDWFAPGFRAGGPITSCVNFAHAMQDHFHIKVLTSDRDLNDTEPYPNITTDCWLRFDRGISIYYCSPTQRCGQSVRDLLHKSQPDFLYLNGMFSTSFTIFPLWQYFRNKLNVNIVLAPRGMLRPSALRFKPIKKYAYLKLLRLSGVTDRIQFHATHEQERDDIHRVFGSKVRVEVIPNCVRPPQPLTNSTQKEAGSLKAISVGRIHPIKNTKMLISVFRRATHSVRLDLYGPIEDRSYWNECQRIIDGLPEHVQVRYCGALPADAVRSTIERYHLFVLPTTGENFGHAIYEALASGKPVLISDQTPWRDLTSQKAGWDLPLNDEKRFVRVLNECAMMQQQQYRSWSAGAWQLAQSFALKDGYYQKYLQMFTRESQ